MSNKSGADHSSSQGVEVGEEGRDCAPARGASSGVDENASLGATDSIDPTATSAESRNQPDRSTNRDKALRGEVVAVSDARLLEMQRQSVVFEGVCAEPIFHWHWAAAINELIALRAERALWRSSMKRCLYCDKTPRSNAAKDNFTNRYPGYCSYGHQELHRLQLAREHLATLPSHVHAWMPIDGSGGARCVCGQWADEWYCPNSPDHICHYDKGNFDSCDYCHQPEERK